MQAWYRTLTLGTLIVLTACTGDDTAAPMDAQGSSSSGEGSTSADTAELTSSLTTSEATSRTDTSSGTTSSSGTEGESGTDAGGTTCGDGVVDGRDVCDGADLDGQDCTSQGFDGGELACAADCTGFDTTGCMKGGSGSCCQPHATAECDDPTCTAAVCAVDSFCCDTEWDDSCASAALDEPACEGVGGCPTCGDGVLEPAEACDDGQLGEETCVSLGFDGGVLGCSDDCTALDVSACEAGGACCAANDTVGCEDGVCMAAVCAFDAFCCDKTWDEVCANEAVLEPACQGASGCPNCGNGELDGVEPCDGDNLGGQTCESQGYVSGALACAANCLSLDETGCQGEGACCAANGTVGCEDMGCTNAVCELDPSCCDVGWTEGCADVAAATPACQGLTGCPNCGNATLDALEVCDGDDLDGESCESLGLNMGKLACTDTCLAFDTTGCFAGTCCLPNGSPNCEDEGCSAAVCAFDPFCCDTQWDDLCAEEAAAEGACAGVGGCP